MMIVYKITNKINKKSYIGLTGRSLKSRWYNHISRAKSNSQKHLHKAIQKYGSEAFSIEILDSIRTREHLSIAEQYWIKKYRTTDPKFGYNMTFGGECGSMIPSVRKRLSDMKTGRHHSAETKQKISIATKGKPGHQFSVEARMRMSLANKGRKFPPLTEEARQKISERLKGRKVSEETRRKISMATKGKPKGHRFFSEEHRKRISLAKTGKKRKPFSLETRLKLSLSHLGKRRTSS